MNVAMRDVALAYTNIISEMFAHHDIHTIAYSDAWNKVFPNKNFDRINGASHGPHLIELACQELHWPQLNVLFVNKKSREPGPGHSTDVVKKYNWRVELEKVKNFKDFDKKVLQDAILRLAEGI